MMKHAKKRTGTFSFAVFNRFISMRFLLIIIVAVPMTLLITHKQTQQYGFAKGAASIFYGVNVDLCLLNPNSPDYVKNSQGQDLIDIAHHLGINFFRITNSGCANGGSDDGSDTPGNWALVLNKMALNSIQALPVVGAQARSNGDTLTSTTVSDVVSYVTNNQLGRYTNVYGVDLVNEPLLNDNNLSLLLQMRNQIKTIYPNLRVTVGGWKVSNGTYGCVTLGSPCWEVPSNGQLLANIVDFYEPHIYARGTPLNGPYPDYASIITRYIDQMLSYTAGKMILIGEVGEHNGNGEDITDADLLGSKELQANAMDGFIKGTLAYQSKGVAGEVLWAFYNRSYYSGTQGMYIVKDSGNTIFPAAYVIQKYATGTSDVPINIPMKIPGNDYSYTINNNGQIVSVNQDDRLGFIFNFSAANSYQFSLSDPSVFDQTQSFMLNPWNRTYYAVLHAVNTGTSTVTITQTNNCTSNCQVFQMTLVVHGSLAPTPTPTTTMLGAFGKR